MSENPVSLSRDINVYQISSDNSVKRELQWKSSANFLCNYMQKIEYLQTAIKNLALMPRYNEEKLDYLNVSGLDAIVFPMTCFCDIPLSKVETHMSTYGRYGIVLKKNACITKDVQPIRYLNPNSRLCRDFSEALNKLYNSQERIDTAWEVIPDALLSQLLYTKPIRGVMQKTNEDPKVLLFQDECEWRFIPSQTADLPLILPPDYGNDKGRLTFSNALTQKRESWFPFRVEDIDYLIVPSEREAEKLTKFIRNLRGEKGIHKWKSNEKDVLISKVEIAEKFNMNLT